MRLCLFACLYPLESADALLHAPGPAASRGYQALVLFAPNSSAVGAVMGNFARAAACPAEPARAAGASKSFYALFRDTSGPAPAQCRDQQQCMATDACWRRLVEGPDAKLVGYGTEASHMMLLSIVSMCPDFQPCTGCLV